MLSEKKREMTVKEWEIIDSKVMSLRDKIQVLEKKKRELWDFVAKFDREKGTK